MKKLRFWLATIAVLLCSVSVSAYDFEVDGIYYNITSETDLTVEVTYRGLFFDPTYSDYTGEVVIPESVTYNGKTYSVTSIRKQTFNECSGLTGVTIPNSVTSIGSSAFYNCSGLTSITIPNSITSIGYEAFYGCSGLTSVYITDLKAWCRIVFDGYYSNPLFYTNHLYLNGEEIKDLVIPNSVTSIGSSAFYNCSGLTSVTIPNSVTSIGNEAFYGCSSLTSVYITDLEAWCKIVFDGYYSNPLFYANHLYLNGEEIKDLVIPNSVTSIGNYAFYRCSGLTSIIIGNSVTNIGESAFSGCIGLITVVNLSNLNLTKESSDHGYVAYYASEVIKADGTVGDYIFTKNGQVYALVHYAGNDKELTLPENYKGNNYIIEAEAFYNCHNLTSITIPNSVTSIGDKAFYNCSGLTSVTIPNSVTSIGDNVFYNCSGLTSITIPNSVTSIGYKAFYNCSGLTSVTIPNSVTSIGNSAFSGCSGLTSVTIGNSVTSIGNSAFSGCSGLTSVTIPNSVTSIGSGAFSGCSGLTSITIPNSVTSIGGYAFRDCSGLTSVYITDLKAWCGIDFKLMYGYSDENPYSNPLFYAEHLYLNGEKVKNLVIPDSVTSIENYAFYGCSGLTSVTIPNSVTSIGYYAFVRCSNLKTVINFSDLEFSKGSKYDGYVAYYATKVINADEQVGDFFFKTIDGNHYLVGYIGNDKELTLPENYESNNYMIEKYAFSDCTGLTSITIPNSVTGIGRYAFCACTGLTNITIGNSVQNIEYGAFYNCTGLTSITIPNSVISIGSYKEGNNTTSAFSGCNQLTKLIIEDGYMYIDLGYSQFIDCPLEYVYIGRNCSYQNVPFKEGNTLKTAVIGPKVTHIENYLFYNCSGLTSITIPNSVTSIGDHAFDGCYGLTSITIPNSVTSIGIYAFARCSGLTSITIPNTVTSIGERAFIGCSSLTDITIPNSVTSIGNGAFEVCSSLKELYIGNSVTSIPNRLLSNCYALEKLYIGSSVTSIGDNLLTNCTNLNTLSVGAKIPPTVNDLGLGSQQYFTVKLQVPEGSKAMYQFAEAWKKFFNIEEFDPATGISDITPDAEEKNLPIYNLQGTRMTEDKENLPTGIYIQGGKKIFIK